MKASMLVALCVTVGASALTAQQPVRSPVKLELRPFAGVYVPTGALRDEFKTATMAGGQVALELSPKLHLLATGSWTHGHTKLPTITDDVTYIWQYDAGVEYTPVQMPLSGWAFRPFAGIGAGARSYDYKATGLDSRTCTAGYGALGSELQMGRYALRFEGRDYLACYESPVSGEKKTRNDLGFALGFAWHLR